jgi:UTP--glucose-1-phosphate uridylyltransferase
MVADHLWVSSIATGCAAQLTAAAQEADCAVSAVQATREAVLPLYGAIGGRPVEGRTGLYQVDTVREKPTPTQAEQELIVPGLRAGHYLCFFGMHVLTPACMALLKEALDRPGGGRVDLSGALARLAQRERYLALDIAGKRYNIGIRYGLFLAQLALIMDGADREDVLAQMVELLAARPGSGGPAPAGRPPAGS